MAGGTAASLCYLLEVKRAGLLSNAFFVSCVGTYFFKYELNEGFAGFVMTSNFSSHHN